MLVFVLHASPARADHTGRLYIKHNGKIALAIDPQGNLFTRGYQYSSSTDAQGLQIKRSGSTVYSIGPDDATNRERLGVLNIATIWSVSENGTVPLGVSGSLLVSASGLPVAELTASGALPIKKQNAVAFAYRGDFRYLTDVQKQIFIDAVIAMDNTFYPGTAGVQNPSGNGYVAMGGASYWDKGGQMHQVLFDSIHGGPVFLPWHRQMMRWMENLLRSYDPLISLPYWDWQTHPVTDSPAIVGPSGWLGAETGRLGFPFDSLDNGGVLAGSWEEPGCNQYYWNGQVPPNTPLCDPSRPPQMLDHYVSSGTPPGDPSNGTPDAAIWTLPTWEQMRGALESVHNSAHGFLCNHGEVSGGRAPEDPMFWLLHTNTDKIWALWQQGDPARETAAGAYGGEGASLSGSIEPWTSGGGSPDGHPLRPWGAPDNLSDPITYTNQAIVQRPLYK